MHAGKRENFWVCISSKTSHVSLKYYDVTCEFLVCECHITVGFLRTA